MPEFVPRGRISLRKKNRNKQQRFGLVFLSVGPVSPSPDSLPLPPLRVAAVAGEGGLPLLPRRAVVARGITGSGSGTEPEPDEEDNPFKLG